MIPGYEVTITVHNSRGLPRLTKAIALGKKTLLPYIQFLSFTELTKARVENLLVQICD